MRNLLIFWLCIFQLGCHKNESSPAHTSNFSFKANSTNYAWDFNYSGSALNGYGLVTKCIGIGNIPTGYLIQGSSQPQNVSAYFFVETDSLAAGSYKWPLPTSVAIIQSGYVLNGVHYAPINTGDSVVVNISSISGNLCSGTFNGVMHDVSTRSIKVEISDGHFNNLVISN